MQPPRRALRVPARRGSACRASGRTGRRARRSPARRRATGTASRRTRARARSFARRTGARSSVSGSISVAVAVRRDLHAEARRCRRGRRTARRSRRSRACRATSASAPKKKTSRREIRSSTCRGKSCGSQAPQAQTTTSAAARRRRAPAVRLDARAEPLRLVDEQLRRAARVQHARVGLVEDARGGRRGRATGRGRVPPPARATRSAMPSRAERLAALRLEAVAPPREPGDADRLPDADAVSTPAARARASRARRASRLYHSTSPWAMRSSRVSPPEADRTVPGAYCSTSVTSQPRSASSRAVDAPKTPAPTTTACHAVGVTVSERTSGRW